MKTLCLYAIVRFMPYAETQEFANVGVVMCVPDKNIFKFKLAPKRFARITQFFDDLDGTIYKTALQVYEAELMRIEKYVKHTDPTMTAKIFQELTRHREGVMYFGNTRTAFIDDVNSKLDGLFEHYVKRAFANDEYIEKVLEKRVKNLFREQHIVGFKKQKLHTSLGGFEVPFVRKAELRTQVIKPLAFAQKTPLLAYEHARNWADRLHRFADNAEQAKENILFAVEPPTEETHVTAFNEALALIIDKGMQTAKDDNAIIEFAKLN